MPAVVDADEHGWRTIQVFSDLHLGHAGTKLESARQLAGALIDSGVVVFNGDTLETRYRDIEEKLKRQHQELQRLANPHRQLCLLTGNHDPDISDQHALSAFNAKVLVMHGDAVFPALSPWGENAAAMRRLHCSAIAEAEQSAPLHLAERLALSREISSHAPIKHWVSTATHSRAKWLLLRRLIQPWHTLSILKCWLDAPRLTDNFLTKYSPPTQIAIVGHTHFPGSWRVGTRRIINLGGFLPGAGQWTAIITDSELSVYKLKQADGHFIREKLLVKLPIN